MHCLYPFRQHPQGNKKDQLRLAIIKPKTKDLEQPEKDEVIRSIKDLRIQALFELVDSKTTGQKSTLTSTSGIIRQKNTHKRSSTITDTEPAGAKRTCTSLNVPFGQGGASDSKIPGVISSQSSVNSGSLGMSGDNNAIWRLSPQLLHPADSMPLPGIEHLLDLAALDNLFESSLSRGPVQETTPPIADHSQTNIISGSDLAQVGQSSQSGMTWTQEDSIVATFPRELHIFSLAEVLANQNIIDFNMERILNKLRVTGILQLFVEHRYKILFPPGFGNLFETCGCWPNNLFQPRSSKIDQLVLHPIPSPRLWVDNLKAWVARVRRQTLMTYIPVEATDREVEAVVVNCRVSETLHSLMWDSNLYMNYLLIVGGAHGPVIWRIW